MSIATIDRIQRAYFDLLADNPVVRRCHLHDEKSYVIPREVLSDNQMQVRSRFGWGPAVLQDVERLLADVSQFWVTHAETLRTAIKEEPASSVHVEDLHVEENAAMYLPFFDRLLVSDQLLQIQTDYEALDRLTNWRPLVINVLTTVMRYMTLKYLYLNPNPTGAAVVFPAAMNRDPFARTAVLDASNKLGVIFLSELCNHAFTDFGDYRAFVRRGTRVRVDPERQADVFSKYRVNDWPGYQAALLKTVYNDLGSDWPGRTNPLELLAFDVLSRLREFERFGFDAAAVAQQAEIARQDRRLYDWWFSTSAKEASQTIGLGYDENFLYKAALQSDDLSFLRAMSVPDVLDFRTEVAAIDLRRELQLARLQLQSEKADLRSVVRETGTYVAEELDHFATKEAHRRKRRRQKEAKDVAGFAASLTMTLASVVAPILSVGSLIWGRSAADLRASRSRRKAEEVELRPLATLVEWRSAHSGGNSA